MQRDSQASSLWVIVLVTSAAGQNKTHMWATGTPLTVQVELRHHQLVTKAACEDQARACMIKGITNLRRHQF